MPKSKKIKIPDFNIPKIPNVEQIDFKKMYTTEVDDDVDQYFSRAELAEMGTYEKSRYKNMKRNYLMMLEFGLPAIKPEFMKGPSYRSRKMKKYAESSSESSDEEWTPSSEQQKRAKVKNSTPTVKPITRPEEKVTVGANKKKLRQTFHKNGKDEQVKKREYPLRQRAHRNFMNLEVPDDDQYLYCEECNKEFDVDCPVHGPLTVVRDTKVIAENDEDRALHSLPPGLAVRTSDIPGAGLGVFAETSFEPRTRFGPYGGDIVTESSTAHASGYCWQIYKDGKPSHFVDAQDKSTANWMRYVNCAPTEAEQNVVAFQFRGQIYYRSYKAIPPGKELLVWYGSDYALELGMVRDKNMLLTPTILNGEEMFPCLYCRTGFSSALPYISHLRTKHGDKLDADDIRVLDGWLYQSKDRIEGSPCIAGIDKQRMDFSKANKLSKCNYKDMAKKCEDDISNDSEGNRKVDTGNMSLPSEKIKTLGLCNRSYKCDVCGKAFKEQGKLQRHLKLHTGERPYKCDVCGKAFSRQDNLQSHLRLHTGERPYKCDVCGKAFTQQGDLKKHLRLHTGERPYKCDVCGKAFNEQGDLKKHLRVHTGERPYKCDVCGKAFNRQCHLQRHLRLHTGERPYKCDVCGKAFIEQRNLQNHLRLHTGERPYKCDVCGKAFNEQGDLKKHLRVHTGERPYKCDVCGKAFNRQAHLQRHLRLHTDERPYKCDVCGKAFNRQAHLQRHLRLHTGERPYKCDVCGKAFNEQRNLQNHLRLHTGERPYKCDVCGKAFNQQSSLKSHLRLHPGEKPK